MFWFSTFVYDCMADMSTWYFVYVVNTCYVLHCGNYLFCVLCYFLSKNLWTCKYVYKDTCVPAFYKKNVSM